MLSEAQIYAEAGVIIDIAMGKAKVSRGRGRPSQVMKRANEDPLGYWCGVEAIVSLVNRSALSTPTPKEESK